jgi:hypothetical protein
MKMISEENKSLFLRDSLALARPGKKKPAKNRDARAKSASPPARLSAKTPGSRPRAPIHTTSPP